MNLKFIAETVRFYTVFTIRYLLIPILLFLTFICFLLIITIHPYTTCFKCSGAEFIISILLTVIAFVCLAVFYFWVVVFNRLYRNEQILKSRNLEKEHSQEMNQIKSTLSSLSQNNGANEDDEQVVKTVNTIKHVSRERAKLTPRTHEESATLNCYQNHKKVLDIVFWSFLIVGAIAFALNSIFTIVVLSLTQSTIATRYGDLYSMGTKQPVVIEREPSGVIHIKAQTDYDMYFAQGYVTAQERMFQMELNRRIFNGTLSEVVGSAALSIDKFARVMGFRDLVTNDINSGFISKSSLDIVQAFADGVNAFIERAPIEKLGPEFNLIFGYRPQKWTVIDSIGWCKLISWDLSLNIKSEVIRYGMLKQGLSVSRIERLFPPMSTFSRDINGAFSPNNITTILTKDDLNLNTDVASDLAQEYRLYFNNSAAYIPKKDPSSRRAEKVSENSSPHKGYFHSIADIYETFISGLRDSSAQDALRDQLLRVNQDQQELFERFLAQQEASNSWVIHKNHTSTGKSMLANDPHLTISAPGIWILLHLQSAESKTDLRGCSFVNTPGISLGRNSDIAWGITVSGPDNQDLYVMKMNPSTSITSNDITKNSYYYTYDGVARPFQFKYEQVKVKKGGSYDIVDVPVFKTHLGPVVNDIIAGLDNIDWASADTMITNGDLHRPIVLRWKALEYNDTTFDGYFKTMKARNFEEFKQALSLITSVSCNYVYADENNIGMFPAAIYGATPIRRTGHTGEFPVPGDVSTWDYDGYVPFDKVPYAFNPAKGYVVTANNRLAPSGYPYQVTSDNAFEFRAKRITELLASLVKNSTLQKIGYEHMMAVQLDGKSLAFESLRFAFVKMLETLNSKNEDKTSNLYKWTEKMTVWDGVTSYGSKESSIFHLFLAQASLLPFAETKTSLLRADYLKQIMMDNTDVACSSNEYSSCIEYGIYAMKKVLEFCQNKFGGIPRWQQDIHYISLEHQLLTKSPVQCFVNRVIRPKIGGGWQVPNSQTVRFDLKTPTDSNPTLNSFEDLRTTHSVSYRQVITFGNDYFIIPLGNSGNPLDQAYDYLADMWGGGEYLPMVTSGYVTKYNITIYPS